MAEQEPRSEQAYDAISVVSFDKMVDDRLKLLPGYEHHLKLVERQLDAMGCQAYELDLFRRDEMVPSRERDAKEENRSEYLRSKGKNARYLGYNALKERFLTKENILSELSSLRYANASGMSIVIRPDVPKPDQGKNKKELHNYYPAEVEPVIVLDDMNSENILNLKKDGIKPCYVVCTSQHKQNGPSFHVIIRTGDDRVELEHVRAQNKALAQAYNGDTRHFSGRNSTKLVGFLANKPGNENYTIMEAENHGRVVSILPVEIARQAEEEYKKRKDDATNSIFIPACPAQPWSDDMHSVFRSIKSGFLEITEYAESLGSIDRTDNSAVDFNCAIAAMALGFSETQTAEMIDEQKGQKHARDYAMRTVKNAKKRSSEYIDAARQVGLTKGQHMGLAYWDESNKKIEESLLERGWDKKDISRIMYVAPLMSVLSKIGSLNETDVSANVENMDSGIHADKEGKTVTNKGINMEKLTTNTPAQMDNLPLTVNSSNEDDILSPDEAVAAIKTLFNAEEVDTDSNGIGQEPESDEIEDRMLDEFAKLGLVDSDRMNKKMGPVKHLHSSPRALANNLRKMTDALMPASVVIKERGGKSDVIPPDVFTGNPDGPSDIRMENLADYLRHKNDASSSILVAVPKDSNVFMITGLSKETVDAMAKNGLTPCCILKEKDAEKPYTVAIRIGDVGISLPAMAKDRSAQTDTRSSIINGIKSRYLQNEGAFTPRIPVPGYTYWDERKKTSRTFDLQYAEQNKSKASDIILEKIKRDVRMSPPEKASFLATNKAVQDDILKRVEQNVLTSDKASDEMKAFGRGFCEAINKYGPYDIHVCMDYARKAANIPSDNFLNVETQFFEVTKLQLTKESRMLDAGVDPRFVVISAEAGKRHVFFTESAMTKIASSTQGELDETLSPGMCARIAYHAGISDLESMGVFADDPEENEKKAVKMTELMDKLISRYEAGLPSIDRKNVIQPDSETGLHVFGLKQGYNFDTSPPTPKEELGVRYVVDEGREKSVLSVLCDKGVPYEQVREAVIADLKTIKKSPELSVKAKDFLQAVSSLKEKSNPVLQAREVPLFHGNKQSRTKL